MWWIIQLKRYMANVSCACLILYSGISNAANSTPLVVLTTFSEGPMTSLIEHYQQDYPERNIQIIYRRTEPAARLVWQPSLKPVDLVISSSPTFFHALAEANLLAEVAGKYKVPAWLESHGIEISPYFIAFGYSGIGLMWNIQYLQKHNLPEPTNWEDLAKPVYSEHIIMSTPSNSGTTYMMVENILQLKGWENGWQLLMQIGGNLASVSARSFGVSDAVSRGLVGIGPVIDSYAFNAQEKLPFIRFAYFPDTILLPTYISVTASSTKKDEANQLISYLLSEKGQLVIASSLMAKVPINNDELANQSHFVLNSKLINQRSDIVKELFEQCITNQLVKLHQVWKMIHETQALLESKNGNSTELQEQLNQAVLLASTPPISEVQAADSVLVDMLARQGKRHYSSQAQKVVQQWQQDMSHQLDKAIELVIDIKRQLQ
ncbi:ABC transporter substrate-binding protein [Photobacterium sp. WH24]|uniref:ABC transporter substrate-binding protein n=1 Tax=Photobacterium sp. WH24 TaxID=2827237 RepID=UPI001C47A330|nr:ABC transporter substrate-binding protein [Photobacterium sp. WH24]MBV7262796.1 ABC transporter substrate-binding protein [Photobacterium sp. WH24]